MKYFALALTLLTLSACDKDDEPTPEPERFEQRLVGADEFELLVDTEEQLVWVNDVRGCFAAIVTPDTQCRDLVFAGRDDWRIPSPDELSELLTEVDERGMQLNYINTNCVLMSSNEEVWVFTENSTSPGTQTTMRPGNAGLRCVTEL